MFYQTQFSRKTILVSSCTSPSVFARASKVINLLKSVSSLKASRFIRKNSCLSLDAHSVLFFFKDDAHSRVVLFLLKLNDLLFGTQEEEDERSLICEQFGRK